MITTCNDVAVVGDLLSTYSAAPMEAVLGAGVGSSRSLPPFAGGQQIIPNFPTVTPELLDGRLSGRPLGYPSDSSQQQPHPMHLLEQQPLFQQRLSQQQQQEVERLYMQQLEYLAALGESAASQSDVYQLINQPAVDEASMPSVAIPGVEEIDSVSAQTLIGSDRPVFLQFYAQPETCPICAAFVPEMRRLGLRFAGDKEIVIAKVDALAQLPLAQRYNVDKMSLPAILFFQSRSSTPEVYEGSGESENLIKFIERRVPGVTKDGQMRELKSLVQQFIRSKQRSESEAIRKSVQRLAEERDEETGGKIQRYVAIMDRVLKRGKTWLRKQRNSLIQKCDDPDVSMEAKRTAQRQLNVVNEFMEALPRETH